VIASAIKPLLNLMRFIWIFFPPTVALRSAGTTARRRKVHDLEKTPADVAARETAASPPEFPALAVPSHRPEVPVL
jgi:hypothetical protein